MSAGTANNAAHGVHGYAYGTGHGMPQQRPTYEESVAGSQASFTAEELLLQQKALAVQGPARLDNGIEHHGNSMVYNSSRSMPVSPSGFDGHGFGSRGPPMRSSGASGRHGDGSYSQGHKQTANRAAAPSPFAARDSRAPPHESSHQQHGVGRQGSSSFAAELHASSRPPVGGDPGHGLHVDNRSAQQQPASPHRASRAQQQQQQQQRFAGQQSPQQGSPLPFAYSNPLARYASRQQAEEEWP